MHTKMLKTAEGELRVHHNSDWSGEAFVSWPNGETKMPAWLARRLLSETVGELAHSISPDHVERIGVATAFANEHEGVKVIGPFGIFYFHTVGVITEDDHRAKRDVYVDTASGGKVSLAPEAGPCIGKLEPPGALGESAFRPGLATVKTLGSDERLKTVTSHRRLLEIAGQLVIGQLEAPPVTDASTRIEIAKTAQRLHAESEAYDGEMHHISAAHASMDDAGRITLHPDAKPVEPEHPAPWRWDDELASSPGAAAFLRDARGNILLSANTDEDISIASLRVRALVEAAPQLFDLLFGNTAYCATPTAPTCCWKPELGVCHEHRKRALLAQIEERSRG